MIAPHHIRVRDRSQVWYERLLNEHQEAAVAKVDELLADTEQDENGCLVTDTEQPRKVRFLGV